MIVIGGLREGAILGEDSSNFKYFSNLGKNGQFSPEITGKMELF